MRVLRLLTLSRLLALGITGASSVLPSLNRDFLILSISKYLLQCDVGIGFSEHILLQLELAVLDGRDGDAVDVADGAVAQTEPREDAQTDVVFGHVGVLLTEVGEAVVVDGVERTFYLAPLVRFEGDERIAVFAEFLHHLRTFENKVL